MIATSRSRSWRISEKRTSTSRTVSDAVGSSIMMIFAFQDSAFAISTICICATLRLRIIVPGLTSRPISFSHFLVSSSISFLRTRPSLLRFSLPRKMFSAMLRSRTGFSS